MSTPPSNEDSFEEPSSALNLFEDIARYAPTMLWVSDVNGAMIFQNHKYLEFTGLSEKAAKSPNSWTERVHPEDLNKAMSAYVNALKEHGSFAVEYRLRDAEGTYRDVLDSARPRTNAQGDFAGYVGSTMDISPQKAQEKTILQANAATKKQSRDLNLLYELKSDLQVCRVVEETRPVLTKYCEQLFPDTSARILLHNNSRDLVEPFLDWGPPDKFESEMLAPTDCWALRKGKNHIEHPTRLGAMCPNARKCDHKSYLCIPMIAFGETVGIMQLDANTAESSGVCIDTPKADTTLGVENSAASMMELCTMTADEIASAIEELKLRAKLQHQSTRDSLTHLFNRRYFMEATERELYRAKQSGHELSLLMLDLDHFKQFNDTHGHIGGDMVLRAFGKVLEDTTRGGDVASRYGGEEFAVIMTECPPAGARKRAEEIRAKTERIALEFHGELLEGISTSIGISSFPRDGDSIEDLISHADKALYAAKAAGRNQVCDTRIEPDHLLSNTSPTSEPVALKAAAAE